MDNTQIIAMLIGAVIPFIISIVKQAGLNKWYNLLIAFVTCVGAGVLTVWARGELEWSNALATIGVIFVSSQAIYAAFWKDAFDNTLNVFTSFIKKTEENSE